MSTRKVWSSEFFIWNNLGLIHQNQWLFWFHIDPSQIWGLLGFRTLILVCWVTPDRSKWRSNCRVKFSDVPNMMKAAITIGQYQNHDPIDYDFGTFLLDIGSWPKQLTQQIDWHYISIYLTLVVDFLTTCGSWWKSWQQNIATWK